MELKPVDIRNSLAFVRMHDLNPKLYFDFTEEKKANLTYNLMALAAKEYVDEHPDFPAKEEVMVLRALVGDEESDNYYQFQACRERYGDDQKAVTTAAEAFYKEAESHQDDNVVLLSHAAIVAVAGNDANPTLLQILHNEENGKKVDNLPLWSITAELTGFEEWYYKTFNDRIINQKTNKTSSSTNSSSGGCYIATAVYGSYDCPEVWTLRRFRDEKLLQTLSGKLFVKLYYVTSPTVVKLFGDTKLFNEFWKSRLNKLVAKLNNEGYENTPYTDK